MPGAPVVAPATGNAAVGAVVPHAIHAGAVVERFVTHIAVDMAGIWIDVLTVDAFIETPFP